MTEPCDSLARASGRPQPAGQRRGARCGLGRCPL